MSTVISDNQTKALVSQFVVRKLHELGWSQTHLADLCGENRMAISRVCRGENVPSVTTIVRMAEAFGCSVDDFFQPVKNFRNKSA